MKPPIYCTFDVFLENYLENFIEANKYEGINIQEYNYTLLFEYGSIAKHLPFNDDELQQEKEYIEKKFGIFQLIFLIDEYDIEGRILTLENTRKVSKILRRQAFKIVNYLKNELLKKEIETADIENRKPNNINTFSKYPEVIQKNANSFFRGKIELIELLIFLSENFYSTNKKTNDLTKFNQIFAHFNSKYAEFFKERGNFDKNAYKNLVFHLFGFDYNGRDIKGETLKHLEQLENLAEEYNKMKENPN